MKKYFFLVTAIVVTKIAGAQIGGSRIKGLKIGDKVPEVIIKNLYNYNNKSSIKLSSLKGKLVILDFWFSTCSGCIAKFPEMEEFQKQFGEKIQIIAVNHETKARVDSIFEYWYKPRKVSFSKMRLPNFPATYGDHIFASLFPHVIEPHEVWIDGNGTVRAITDAEQVTAKNIQKILDDPAATLPEKIAMMAYDQEMPTMPQIFDMYKDSLKYYSSLFRCYPDVFGGSTEYNIDSAKGTIRMTRVGQTILQLYANALRIPVVKYVNPFRDASLSFGKRVILEIKDSSKLMYPSNPDDESLWQRDHAYVYEAVLPLEEKDKIYDNLLQDLNRYFHYNGRLEKRKTKCVALVRISDENKIFDKNNLMPEDEYQKGNNGITYRGSMAALINNLAEHHKDLIFVNNIKIPNEVPTYLQGRASLDDIDAVRKEIREKYDLDLIETEQYTDFMVISDKL